MSHKDQIKFKLWNGLTAITDMLKKWEISGDKSEREYEESLYSFLHSELPDIQITKQYALGRARADLLVGDKVIIELKKDLNTTSKYQRLMGQIDEYAKWSGKILIVLLGNTEPNLLKKLKKHIKDSYNPFTLLEDERLFLFEKEINT